MSGCNAEVYFEYSIWQATYPEFNATLSAGEAQQYWNTATLYLDSGPYSIVRMPKKRAMLLGMLTAHLAKLFSVANGVASSDLVGRISSATKGSVSVSAEMPADVNAAWFQQTKYGAAFWAATAVYRTFRYAPGPQPYLGVSRNGGYTI